MDKINISKIKKSLDYNGFNFSFVPTVNEANDIILKEIPKESSIGIGGSITIREIGIIDDLYKRGVSIQGLSRLA